MVSVISLRLPSAWQLRTNWLSSLESFLPQRDLTGARATFRYRRFWGPANGSGSGVIGADSRHPFRPDFLLCVLIALL
jgi:hypothetical protein